MTSPDITSVVVPGSSRYGAIWRPDPSSSFLRATGRPPRPYTPVVQPTGAKPVVYGARTRVTPVVTPPDPGGDEPFIYGVTRPTRANTGLMDPSLVVAYPPTANHTFSANGTQANPIIISNQWFTKKVSISGQWYRFENCWFSGDWNLNTPPIVATNANSRNNVIYRSVIWSQNPRTDNALINGHGVTLDRVYGRNGSEGYGHIGYSINGNGSDYTGADQNVGARGCLFEKAAYASPDYGGAGKLPDNASHLDYGCQVRGGKNFDFFGCAIYGFLDPNVREGGKPSVDMPLSGTHVSGRRSDHPGLYTLSLFMFSPPLGAVENFRCDSCWLDGATYMFVLAERVSGVSVTNNRMGRLHRTSPGIMSVHVPQADVGVVLAGNHYWYELGPNGEKWPYNQVPDAQQGETMPDSAKIAAWTAAGIKPNDETTWPSSNIRTRG